MPCRSARKRDAACRRCWRQSLRGFLHRLAIHQAPLKALIFDSWFDNYQGVIVLTRVVDGALRPGMKIKVMSNDRTFEVMEVGQFTPKRTKRTELLTGEVGYLCANMREVADVKIGDTLTDAVSPTSAPFPGYKEVKPLVFCGLYPTDTARYEDLRDALVKLRLNDSSFVYEPETSLALGFGFRCGFLGLLHMEIIQERLEREYDLTLLTTAPTVVYRVLTTKGEVLEVNNPSQLPPPSSIDSFEEPFILALGHYSRTVHGGHPQALSGTPRYSAGHAFSRSDAGDDQL